MKKYITQFVPMVTGTVTLFLLYFQITSWHSTFFGLLLGIVYLVVLTVWWRDILHHVFRFEKGFVSVLLSVFAALFFVSSIEAVLVALYTTTPVLTWWAITFSGITTYLLRMLFLARSHGSKIVGKGRKQYIDIFPKVTWLSYIYVALWIVTGILFIRAEGTGALFSPWQSLSSWILPLVFVLTALLGFITFSKQKTKHILVLILMHSFLLHLYLPLSHELPWGGDVWRHIASESQLAAGEIIPPVLFGPEAKWREVAGVDLPEVFLIPQKYAYGQFWSLAIITNQLTGISLQTINIWMMPLLWSLLFPLILFRIGRILFRSWRGGIFLAWLSFIAFPLQALGALTLPVSLGVLTFFFTFMLWLQYLGRRHTRQLGLLILFIFLMLFGYSLAFLLMLLVVLGSWLLGRISTHVRSARLGWSLVALATILGMLVIPIVEVSSGSSQVLKGIHTVAEGKQVVGQLSGWYYASAIRPHGIVVGNLFFNHTPDYAFVSNMFTSWRWWVMAFMILFWISLVYGVYHYVREKQPLRFLLPAWMLLSLVGAYHIGWFHLEGDRLFTRRLDPFLSTLVLLFVCLAWLTVFYYIRYKPHIARRSASIVLIFVVSWFSSATYASGPDMRTSSVDEYAVAEFVLAEVRSAQKEYCVLADTWILLPLEGLSGGDIVGGNFPIAYQFGQAERVALLDAFQQEEVATTSVQHMFEVAQTPKCYVVMSANKISEDQERRITAVMEQHPIRYSGFLLWIQEDPLLKSIEE